MSILKSLLLRLALSNVIILVFIFFQQENYKVITNTVTKRKIGKKGFKLIHASGDFLSRSDAAKKMLDILFVVLFHFLILSDRQKSNVVCGWKGDANFRCQFSRHLYIISN